MKTEDLQCYTWSNHGNLGDDWISSVAPQYFPKAIAVREKRSVNPYKLGRYVLKRDDRRRLEDHLVLWGGGWLAADRPGSRTVSTWARHLSKPDFSVSGIGLGFGPFMHADCEQHTQIEAISEVLSGALSVRTYADLKHIPAGYQGSVGCDVALLDKRFFESCYSGGNSNYDVMSFPAYSSHWMGSRPWMTEEWYRYTVESMVRNRPASRVVFVEFDQMLGSTSDGSYWKHLADDVIKPSTIRQAARIFRDARSVFAGRLHAGILAAVVGAPTLALAYHHKFEVLSELGIPTINLVTEPKSVPRPDTRDSTVLEAVRRRGVEQLSLVRC